MVVLATAITSKTGKVLLSRQFVPITRSKIESIISVFPKLIGTGNQHTYIETENVRYLYQSLDELYVVVVTSVVSNIVEDLHTLSLVTTIVNDYCRTINEKSILDKSFELIFAFDEVVALGYKEKVTLENIKKFTSMESRDEVIHEISEQNRIRAVQEETNRKIKERDLLMKEGYRDSFTGRSSYGGDSPYGGRSGSGSEDRYGRSDRSGDRYGRPDRSDDRYGRPDRSDDRDRRSDDRDRYDSRRRSRSPPRSDDRYGRPDDRDRYGRPDDRDRYGRPDDRDRRSDDRDRYDSRRRSRSPPRSDDRYGRSDDRDRYDSRRRSRSPPQIRSRSPQRRSRSPPQIRSRSPPQRRSRSPPQRERQQFW